MLHQGDQDLLCRAGLAGIAEHDRNARAEVERDANVLRVEVQGAVKAVDGDDERQLVFLEVVDGRKAVRETAGIGQDRGAGGVSARALRPWPVPGPA